MIEDPPSTGVQKRASCWRNSKEMIKQFLDRWPRLVALAKCQIWFMLLLSVSFLMGRIISNFEGPTEIQANDSHMRRSFMAKELPIEPTIANLVALPAACMVHFRAKLQEEKEQQLDYTSRNVDKDNNINISNETIVASWNNTNYSMSSYIDRAIADLNYLRMDAVMLTNTNTDWEEFASFTNLTFQSPRKHSNSNNRSQSLVATADTIDSTEYYQYLNESDDANPSFGTKILGYAEACRGIAEELVLSLVDFSIEVNSLDHELRDGRSNGGLSFDWIRCWNESSYGIGPYYRVTTESQRNASLFTSQMLYFDVTWNKNREELYDSFVIEQGCDDMPNKETNITNNTSDNIFAAKNAKDLCYWEAMMKSVSNATGAEGCQPNTAAAAWFWFTVMTTVGYGNAPVNTFSSRVLVYCFGWLMIIAFGAIMVSKASTLTALLDDIFRRTNLVWLNQPRYSAPLWSLATFLYTMLVAWYARYYWDSYIPHDVYTLGDSYWFSYVTLLTVGLGDYYVQPQGLFYQDVVSWAFLLLYGFGILASFLDRSSNLIASWLPEREEPFEYHLARTDILGTGMNTSYSKSLEVLRKLATECYSEDDHNGTCAKPVEVKYRSSFTGRDDSARAPDGNPINLHRIKILTEKKTLLIKLLLANQSELDHRMALYASKRMHSKKDAETTDNKGEDIGSSLSSIFFIGRGDSSVSLPMPTVEALKHDEEVLNSILFRTQELRRQLDNSNIGDGENVEPFLSENMPTSFCSEPHASHPHRL